MIRMINRALLAVEFVKNLPWIPVPDLWLYDVTVQDGNSGIQEIWASILHCERTWSLVWPTVIYVKPVYWILTCSVYK